MMNAKPDVSKIKSQAHKLSSDEKTALCKTWETSGLTKRQFCKKHALAPASFYKWCQCLPSTRQKAGIFKVPISEFMPVHAAPTVNSNSDPDKMTPANKLSQNSTDTSVVYDVTLEIKLPNTTTIQAKLPLGQASVLLKEMINAASALR